MRLCLLSSLRRRGLDVSMQMVGVVIVLGVACATPPAKLYGGIQNGPPSAPGPFFVSELKLDEVNGTLFLPTNEASVGAIPKSALPWVVLLPGFASVTNSYAETARFVASHGFLVTALEHDFGFGSALLCETQRDGFERVVASIKTLRERNRSTGIAAAGRAFSPGLFADERVGVVGHSYGGKLALWAALDSDGVVAVFGLDPVDGGDKDRRPGYCAEDPAGFPPIAPRLSTLKDTAVVLVGAGLSGECAPRDGNADVMFAGLTGSRALLSIPKATHTDFVDVAGPDCGFLCGLCPASEVEAKDVRGLSREAMVALFRSRLIEGATAFDAVSSSVDAAQRAAHSDGFVEFRRGAVLDEK